VALRAQTLAVLVLAPSLVLGPGSKAATAESGSVAFDAGRYEDALRIWSASARTGDPTAEFNLGLLYDLGDAVPENPSTALKWYSLAGQAGLAGAQFNVGVMYDSGRGTERNTAAAAVWYARAAAQGYARAAFNLGQLYELGDGVPRNRELAAGWYGRVTGLIPRASIKINALNIEPRASSAGWILPPIPSWPLDHTEVSASSQHASVELVWQAPSQPIPVRFFVEMRALKDGAYQEYYSGYADLSAVDVQLSRDEFFAWRVASVASDGSSYSFSPWHSFRQH
jgi:hypothetical protein